MKRVSIIIPFFNTPNNLIDKCIESIVMSSYKNIEVIIVDDGSYVNFAKHIDDIQQTLIDFPMKVYHQKNGGPSAARNYGLKKAKGEYILFLDSDDFISTDYISELVKNINYFGSDIAYSSMNIVDVDGNRLNVLENSKTINRHSFSLDVNNYNRNLIIKAMWDFGTLPVDLPENDVWISVCIGGKLFKKSILKGIEFDRTLVNGEDQVFSYDVLQKVNKISFVNKGIYYYRMNGDSIMHTASTDTIDCYLCLFKAIKKRVGLQSDLYGCKIEHEVRAMFRIITDNSNFQEYKKIVRNLYSRHEFEEIRRGLSVKYSDTLDAKFMILMVKLGLVDLIYITKRIKLMIPVHREAS